MTGWRLCVRVTPPYDASGSVHVRVSAQSSQQET